MVQHCLDKNNQWMKEQGIWFDEHWVWSDGAASYFNLLGRSTMWHATFINLELV